MRIFYRTHSISWSNYARSPRMCYETHDHCKNLLIGKATGAMIYNEAHKDTRLSCWQWATKSIVSYDTHAGTKLWCSQWASRPTVRYETYGDQLDPRLVMKPIDTTGNEVYNEALSTLQAPKDLTRTIKSYKRRQATHALAETQITIIY